jgi:DNA-binding SARP family transcriptional activator
MFFVDDLLLLPVKGFTGLLKKIAEVAEEEYTDDGKIKEELMRLHTLFEIDQISEEEHDRLERKLMKRLEEIRKYKQLKQPN